MKMYYSVDVEKLSEETYKKITDANKIIASVKGCSDGVELEAILFEAETTEITTEKYRDDLTKAIAYTEFGNLELIDSGSKTDSWCFSGKTEAVLDIIAKSNYIQNGYNVNSGPLTISSHPNFAFYFCDEHTYETTQTVLELCK